MTESRAPEEVYEAVAQDRFVRWGYDETLGEDGRAAYVAYEAAGANLRRDADLVWRMAKEAS